MDAAIVQNIYGMHVAVFIKVSNQIKVVPGWKALKGWNKHPVFSVTEREREREREIERSKHTQLERGNEIEYTQVLL